MGELDQLRQETEQLKSQIRVRYIIFLIDRRHAELLQTLHFIKQHVTLNALIGFKFDVDVLLGVI